jgi:hypothetical protein
LRWWIVSGSSGVKVKSAASPDRAACSQKMTRHDVYVTMMPPMKGPSAGPMSVPDRNQPSAVARSVGG